MTWHRLEIVGHENAAILGSDPKYLRVADTFQPCAIRTEGNPSRARAGGSRRLFHDEGSRPPENEANSTVDSVRTPGVLQSPPDLFGYRVGIGEFVFHRFVPVDGGVPLFAR